MIDCTFVKTYPHFPFDKREILRYAGCNEEREDVQGLLEDCLRICTDVFSYRICAKEIPMYEFTALFGKIQRLEDCKKVVLFGGTVGIEMDRLLQKYQAVSPAKAVMLQAIGTERIEGLCDVFCAELGEMYKKQGLLTKARISPGYGDFPLEKQKEIFQTLDLAKRIGLTLNDSLLMSPMKSVTAAVGIKEE